MPQNKLVEEVLENLIREKGTELFNLDLSETKVEMMSEDFIKFFKILLQQERQTSQEREREIVEAERNRIKALFPPLNSNSDSWGTTEMERILKEITNPNKD